MISASVEISCKDCLYFNELLGLTPDRVRLVPGVSAVCLSTPDTLSVRLCAGRPFHPESTTPANTQGWTPALLPRTLKARQGPEIAPDWLLAWRKHGNISDKWNRKYSYPSYTTCDLRWWGQGLSFKSRAGGLTASVSFHLCLCLHCPAQPQVSQASPSATSLSCSCLDSSVCLCVLLHLSSYVAPHLLVVIPSETLLWLHPHPPMVTGGTECLKCGLGPMFLLPLGLIHEAWVSAPPCVIDGRDALSSHPPRPTPSQRDGIAFHELIFVAPRSCTSNAGTTLV